MQRDLKRAIEEAYRVVIFTGAGISTESGIPDFRSPGGLWTKMAPIDFQDYLRSADIRAEAWRRKFEIDRSRQTLIARSTGAIEVLDTEVESVERVPWLVRVGWSWSLGGG